MRWHYNLGGNPATLVRDMVVYNGTSLTGGAPVTAIAGANQACLQTPSGATIPDFVGVLANTPASSISAVSSGTLKFGKVILNPDAVYIAEYDSAAANDVDVVSSTSSATTLGTCDDNLDGGWLYLNSGTGVGQLVFIGSASTTVMTLDTTSAYATTPDSTTDVILIRPPFAKNKDLDSTYTLLANDEDETGKIIVLENYIEAATVAMEPLRPRQHHGLTGLNNAGVRFYSDIIFEDNVLRTATWCS